MNEFFQDRKRIVSGFDGEHRFLSNFWISPFIYKGRIWKTSEHAYQAMKTTTVELQEHIRALRWPSDAKKFGSSVRLRLGWKTDKYAVMREILMEKFTQNKNLLQRLLDTGDSNLVESNTWHDNDWGDCTCPECKHLPGKNMLGIMLMLVRKDLRVCEVFHRHGAANNNFNP